MSYLVRVVQPSDMPQLIALRVQCNQKKAHGDAERWTQSSDVNQRLRCAMLTLVCEEEGLLKGFVSVTVSPSLPLTGLVQPTWSIIEFCVSKEDAQAGSALLQEISHRANEDKGYVFAIW